MTSNQRPQEDINLMVLLQQHKNQRKSLKPRRGSVKDLENVKDDLKSLNWSSSTSDVFYSNLQAIGSEFSSAHAKQKSTTPLIPPLLNPVTTQEPS